MLSELIEHIQNYIYLTPEEIEILSNEVSIQTISRKAFLLKEGEVCEANYFVLKGCLRLYSVDDDLKEQTVQFAIEHWWISDYLSLENSILSSLYIQATEETIIAVLPRAAQDELFERLPQLERYFRIIYQRAYAASIWRIHHIFSKTGEERYFQFVKMFPNFVQRIPQYMLASFLGVTPEFISTIRAKK